MKKKITSLILIVALLLLPFSMLLTVKATTQTANGVTYDDSRTKSGDSSSYYVTGTSSIKVNGIGGKNLNDFANEYSDLIASGMTGEEANAALSTWKDENADHFTAYKIVDTYYNPTANQFSYAFTTAFSNFLSSLPSTDTFYQLTVNQYLALTSDVEPNSTGNSGDYQSIHTSSTLNILASKYAAYIRANASGQNAVTGSAMTTGITNGNDGTHFDVFLDSAETGAYLILPDTNTAITKNHDGMIYQQGTVYGAMVVNLFYTLNPNNSSLWTLNYVGIHAKYNNADGYGGLYPYSVSTLMSLMNGLSDQEQSEWMLAHDAGQMTKATIGDAVTFMSGDIDDAEIPTNTHDSIKNNQNVVHLLEGIRLNLPSGFSFYYTDAKSGDMTTLVAHNGNYYYEWEDEENGQMIQKSELVIEPLNSSSAYIFGFGMLTINVSDSHAFTAGVPNIIKVQRYYIKDAYIDIGSNVTAAEVEAALAPGLTNPTSRQQQIQKAFGVLEQNLEVYIYGVKINNTNSSNTNLSGGVFQAYSDSECTQTIGQPFTVTNGVGSFVGISGYDTIYIKQTKAPTGYRLYDKTLYLIPTVESEAQGQAFTKSSPKVKKLASDQYHDEVEVELGQDNYYTVTVVNQPMGFLPFTGGTGTIIYTCIGLLIVLGAVLFLIVYKKKNKKEDEKK